MHWLLFASGFISLTSQALFQRLVSLSAGDLYTTFAFTSLVFIVGSAIGSFLGPFFRKHLSLLEITSGLILLIASLVMKLNPAELAWPLAVIFLLIAPSAFILGTHLPLYIYYFRNNKFQRMYGLYHLGAVPGLLGLEYLFIQGLPLTLGFLTLGLMQVALGFAIWHLQGRGYLKVEGALSLKSFLITQKLQKQFAWITLTSTLSYAFILWAIRSQVFITESLRLQGTAVTAAVFLWMWTAGFTKDVKKSRTTALAGWALSVVSVVVFLDLIPPFLTGLNNGSVLTYIMLSWMLAVYLCVPVFFSTRIFLIELQDLSKDKDIDISTGILNLAAGIGAIGGVLYALIFAKTLWTFAYLGTLFSIVLLVVLLYKELPKKSHHSLILVLLVAVVALFAFGSYQAPSLLKSKVAKETRHDQFLIPERLLTRLESNVALVKYQDEELLQDNLFYMVDGHISHDLLNYHETLVGLLPAMLFNDTLKQSMVIGTGTGQTAWGVNAISNRTDVVDISPSSIDFLNELAEFNFQLLEKKNIEIHLKDAFQYLKNCPSQSHDLILNTSTYPGTFNASKLYSQEFINLVRQCLQPDGVYVTYFDRSVVRTWQDFVDFMAPLENKLPYVHIFWKPYPIVVASQNPKQFLREFNSTLLRTPEDLQYFELISEGFTEENFCTSTFTVPALHSDRVSTLNRSFIEANSIRNMIYYLALPSQEKDFSDLQERLGIHCD